MGKGSCRSPDSESPSDSISQSKHDESSAHSSSNKDKTGSLIEYQKLIESDPNNISLTKEILTKKMAYDLNNVRTSTGDGLAQCVYINVNNPSSKYPYAMSSECYNTFGDFFGEIIERIHGIPQQFSHLIPHFGCLKHGSLIDLNSFDKKRDRALYSEISVRRNLQGIPFSPRMSSSNRKDVISKIESHFRNACAEYEELPWMPADWENRMDDLKNELDDVGCMKQYPDDRLNVAFLCPSEVSIGCVFNFDDHVQYIGSSNDGRLGAIAYILYHIFNDDNIKTLEYEAHPVYGHLTINPAYVGTGFTIKVLGKFPFISRLADANSLVADFDVAIEKECDHIHTGLIIMRNIKTLNKTEVEIMKDFVKAFNKLSMVEDEFEVTTPMSVQDDIASAENIYHLRDVIMENPGKTYTKKYFTDSILFQYAKSKTKFGGTFTHCIRHNAYYPNSLYPRACDSDCYYIFENFFNPIILESNMTKSFNHSKYPVYGSTIADNRYLLRHENIYSYRVRFTRNVSKFPFPNLMSNKDKKLLEKMMIKIFDEIPVEFEGEYCSIANIRKSVYYEDILEYKLIKPPNEVDMAAGFYKDWPQNRGIFTLKKDPNYPGIMTVILINVQDHIKVVSYDPSGKALHLCYERTIELMKFLDLRLQDFYSKRSGYGFLTSSPNNVGCGLRISAMVHLKMLGEKRDILEKICKEFTLIFRGSAGSGTPAVNNIFDISFKLNLNVKENYVIMMFVQLLKELIFKERELDLRVPKPTNDEEDDEDESDAEKSSSLGNVELENVEEIPPNESTEVPVENSDKIYDNTEKMNTEKSNE